MCRRLRCCIPHHVQLFFDNLHGHLRRSDRNEATLQDVALVYSEEMLTVRGQMHLNHYENRLRIALGPDGHQAAFDLLSETAANDGLLCDDAIDRCRASLVSRSKPQVGADSITIEYVLYVLEHDGYLERRGSGYRFVSGLLEDWWRSRYGKGGQ